MLGPSRRLGSLLGTSRAAAAALDAVLSKPIAEQGARPLSSSTSAAAADHQTADEAWCHEVQGAEGGGGGDGGDRRQRGRQGSRRLDAPIDAPRTLRDYQNIVVALSRRKRAYLIRDVLDEMSLNGVRPDRFILTTGLFACMKNRKLGDALHFFEELKRRGMRPDSGAYSAAISACGRAGQLAKALTIKDEMLAAGLPMTHNIRLALLHSCAEAGKMAQAREWFDEIVATGRPADEFAFAGLANCYRQMPARMRPDDVEGALLGLLEEFRTARAAADQQQAEAANGEDAVSAAGGSGRDSYYTEAHLMDDHGHERVFTPRSDDGRPYSPLLVVVNAVLNSLVEMGRHSAATALYARLGPDFGLQPNHTTYSNIIRSHITQALGRHRQPSGDALTALLDERLRHADLTADIELVLNEDPVLKAALLAAEAAEAAGASDLSASAADLEPGAAPAAAVEEEEEEDLEPGAAALAALGGRRDSSAALVDEDEDNAPLMGGSRSSDSSDSSSSSSDEEEETAEAAAPLAQHSAGATGSGASSARWRERPGQPPRTSGGMSYEGVGARQLRQIAADRAANHTRSRLRFLVFREHLDEGAWDEALHLFQEVLDQGLLWGPDITYAMVRAALDMQAAGVEDAMDVAHTVMDTFDRQGLFVDVEHGTELLMLAVRRDVGDLSLAHRVYDSMRGTLRVPKTIALFKYMRALAQREPHNTERLIELCTRIASDPDSSDRVKSMKAEAYQRREALLGPGQRAGGQHQRRQHQQGGRRHDS